jgi:hypothetical protein
MHTLQLQLNTLRDNDSVVEAALRMLASNGTDGFDDLLDSLNGAFNDDEAHGGNTGRDSLHAALEAADNSNNWEGTRELLLRGVLERVLALKLFA